MLTPLKADPTEQQLPRPGFFSRFFNWNNWSLFNLNASDNYWGGFGRNYGTIFNFNFTSVNVSTNKRDKRQGDNPSALAAIAVFMLMLSAAVMSVMYSLTKMKKATENILSGRKLMASTLRFAAAATFGYFGWVWGVEIGLFYAPALLGSLSVPVFGVLGVLVISGVGILFTKYLLQAARWFQGLPTNSGHDSLSGAAVKNYQNYVDFDNAVKLQDSYFKPMDGSTQGVKGMGQLRSYLYELEKMDHPDPNAGAYRALVGQGLFTSSMKKGLFTEYSDRLQAVKGIRQNRADEPGTLQKCAHLARISTVMKKVYGIDLWEGVKKNMHGLSDIPDIEGLTTPEAQLVNKAMGISIR